MKNFKGFFGAFFCLFLLSSQGLYAKENQSSSPKKLYREKSLKISKENEKNNQSLTIFNIFKTAFLSRLIHPLLLFSI